MGHLGRMGSKQEMVKKTDETDDPLIQRINKMHGLIVKLQEETENTKRLTQEIIETLEAEVARLKKFEPPRCDDCGEYMRSVLGDDEWWCPC